MTQSLKSIRNDTDRNAAIARRIKNNAGGLGTLAAQDALKRQSNAAANKILAAAETKSEE
jgi:hypothetical protein